MPGDSFYSSTEWRTARREHLQRHPVCVVAGCGRRAAHVDHVKSRRSGGAALDPRNFMALCHSHHSSKTCQADGGFGRKAKAGGAVLRAHGCDAAGRPVDPNHHWHRPAAETPPMPARGPARPESEGGRGVESPDDAPL